MQKDITENSLQKGCSFNLIKSEKQKCRTKTVVEFKKKYSTYFLLTQTLQKRLVTRDSY